MIPLAKIKRPERADEDLVDETIGVKPLHAYQRFAADRRKAAPKLAGRDLHRLTGPARRPVMGTGDARPIVLRPGCTDHLSWPSRAGNRLHWPDGRVTELDGVTPVTS